MKQDATSFLEGDLCSEILQHSQAHATLAAEQAALKESQKRDHLEVERHQAYVNSLIDAGVDPDLLRSTSVKYYSHVSVPLEAMDNDVVSVSVEGVDNNKRHAVMECVAPTAKKGKEEPRKGKRKGTKIVAGRDKLKSKTNNEKLVFIVANADAETGAYLDADRQWLLSTANPMEKCFRVCHNSNTETFFTKYLNKHGKFSPTSAAKATKDCPTCHPQN